MTRSLIFAATSITLATALVFFCASKYGKKSDARSYLIAAPILLLLVVVIAAGTQTYELRCPDDPLEYCTYNDSEPILFILAVGHLAIALVKSWTLYTER